jgi:hypothetical protein
MGLLVCWVMAGWSTMVAGCGEIDVERLVVRPSFEDYQNNVQPMLIALGCSLGAGCHLTDFRGEVRIVAEPNTDELYRDYQSLKALSNLASPDQSILLKRLLVGEPSATHQPLCFKAVDDCGYRKLRAWIAWDGTGPRPQDVACSYDAEGCFR